MQGGSVFAMKTFPSLKAIISQRYRALNDFSLMSVSGTRDANSAASYTPRASKEGILRTE